MFLAKRGRPTTPNYQAHECMEAQFTFNRNDKIANYREGLHAPVEKLPSRAHESTALPFHGISTYLLYTHRHIFHSVPL